MLQYASMDDDYAEYRRREDGSLDVQPPSDLTMSLDSRLNGYARPGSARTKPFRGTFTGQYMI